MNIINFYESMPKKFTAKAALYKNYDQIKIKIPNRMMIVGSSGSGKSNVLLNLVYGINAFTKIYLFVKSPEEPLYQFLINDLQAVETKLKIEILTVSTQLDELPEVDEFSKEEMNLVIFDDIITEKLAKLQKVSDLWVRGRKQNVTTIFLTQSYHSVPKLIRQNTDVLLFKKIGTKRDLTLILSEYGLDKTVDELREMYKASNTSDICNFFMIDMSPGQRPELMYRHNFNPI